MSSCSRRVTRVYYAMFSLFWLNLSFLLSILYVIQRDFLDTHRNDDDSFVSLRRSAQYDVSSHNIHMFACFDIRIFYDYIFDIWSIDEYCTDNSLLFFPEKVSIIFGTNIGIFLVSIGFYYCFTTVWPRYNLGITSVEREIT